MVVFPMLISISMANNIIGKYRLAIKLEVYWKRAMFFKNFVIANSMPLTFKPPSSKKGEKKKLATNKMPNISDLL